MEQRPAHGPTDQTHISRKYAQASAASASTEAGAINLYDSLGGIESLDNFYRNLAMTPLTMVANA